jgi:catechol 2,3-dioxygenase-like lactoylglutathione lyase family enzyme
VLINVTEFLQRIFYMLKNQKLKAFVSTTQPDRSRRFYKETLGLKLLSEDHYGIEFEANEAHIRISIVEKLTPQPFTVLGWDTKDIVSTIKSLINKGVTFERYNFIEQDDAGIWTAPDGTRVAWFKDPDGNLLSLSE